MAERKRQMIEFICTIHDKAYAYERGDGGEILSCPRCERKALDEAWKQLETVTRHRDALLAAIEIKQTVVPVSGGSHV